MHLCAIGCQKALYVFAGCSVVYRKSESLSRHAQG